MTSDNPVTPRPAATCVVLVETAGGLEVLLTQRSQNLASFTGMWVFPGGVFESQDYQQGAIDDLEQVGRWAASREVEEETGVQLDANALAFFSHWTTPSRMKKRWATWFYLALLRKRPSVQIDPAEVADYRWLSIGEAIALQANGTLPMSPPTLVTLNHLAEFDSLKAVGEFLATHSVDYVQPRAVTTDEGNWIIQPNDAAFESGDLNCDGPRDRLLITKGGLSYVKTDG